MDGISHTATGESSDTGEPVEVMPTLEKTAEAGGGEKSAGEDSDGQGSKSSNSGSSSNSSGSRGRKRGSKRSSSSSSSGSSSSDGDKGDQESSDDGHETVGEDDDEVSVMSVTALKHFKNKSFPQELAPKLTNDGDARKQAVLKACFGDSDGGDGAALGPGGDVSCCDTSATALFQ